jgi:hypothetical protein
VISFGLTAFAVVLIRQTYAMVGTDDLNEMRFTDLPIPVEKEATQHAEEIAMEPAGPENERMQ